MGFTEAVRTVLREKYATFSGRASRSEYWWFYLFYVLVAFAFAVVAIGVATASGGVEGGVPSTIIAIGAIGGLFVLGTIIPFLAVQIRRFHDRNMSGWWYLALIILGLIPYVGFIASIAIFVISVLPGTVGPNKFGPDPLRPEVRAEVFA
ncbi:uncharacterized membrane protein YhaH (DUF805 family) [Rhizobium sp. BK196]|jgi:uncharacterized membrane protein YhaH (DUF805 family)|uniref:DUF805 domain-containing protein n=1 Tax=unclassified Rhizobium TaxID=2613769 RepID=UPI00160BEE08|nr:MULTISPECIES: DUF805 domain-containing protein [unclassified Rhizobium]MBB3308640.1 uncharacterized membrane protein YhaH (DUF805 family) [Rhizobium sp. BK196]MBB3461478.1 uncharacterized membrane protein YhaH (DUF805 family) [Rhizobium sp. BK377]